MNEDRVSRPQAAPREGNRKKPRNSNNSNNNFQGRSERVQTEIDPNVAPLDLSELKHDKIEDLREKVEKVGLSTESLVRKQDLVFAMLKYQTAQKGAIYGEGVLETFPDG